MNHYDVYGCFPDLLLVFALVPIIARFQVHGVDRSLTLISFLSFSDHNAFPFLHLLMANRTSHRMFEQWKGLHPPSSPFTSQHPRIPYQVLRGKRSYSNLCHNMQLHMWGNI